LTSDTSNSEARNQFDLTEKIIQTAQEAKNSYAQEDYTKAIELLTAIIEV
jgi:hypothetical protein